MSKDLQTAALHKIDAAALTIKRRRRGNAFTYVHADGRPLRDKRLVNRLRRLAVPPAYSEVVYAADPRAHIQAIGRDAAGRAQYRYHPDWEKVRELRKARRLARLVHGLPRLRAAVARRLAKPGLPRDVVLAAVIELVGSTALRAGGEAYAQANGTRGAATLLKSNVTVKGDTITLRFRGKGGKVIEKECRSRRLARVVKRLQTLPGTRLFQYHDDDGAVRPVRRREVNAFLRELAEGNFTLKDLRTFIACGCALEQLAALEPKPSERGRRKQVMAALREVAQELANTPAICRKSYVHAAVVEAFESGALRRLCNKNGGSTSAAARERMLSRVLATVGR